jgi:deoxyribose-phosphate aldolase
MTLTDRIQKAIIQFKDFHIAEVNDSGPSPLELACFIDHTLLKPDATEADVRKLCQEAIEYNFKTACVNSSWLPLCSNLLSSSSTIPIAVIGFPLGAGLTASKSMEAKMAIDSGAKEIDMVIPIGRLRGEDYDYVYNDIKVVYETCGHIPLKIILETSMLTREEIVAACWICKEVGVAFVKTSTGFGGGGASVEHVALMKAVVGDGIEVKASGGIRSYEDAVKMYNAGARRLGASASVAIVNKQKGVRY